MATVYRTRREFLATGAALTASLSVGLAAGGVAAQPARSSPTRATAIDAVLRKSVESKDVPGVVALASNGRGIFYEGAFGKRNLANGPDMTPDTIFRIASMTKAITSVAAMQLVEQRRLSLDEPIGKIVPELAAPQVLEGFDDKGEPKLRPAKRPITLRHLLTHTAGFAYEVWDENIGRYVKATGTPSTATAKLASLRLPLVFDPGERWMYGINIEWTGRAIEAVTGLPLAVYFRDHIFGPLGMADTDYLMTSPQQTRVVSVHQRKPEGLEPISPPDPPWREFWSGGGGLYSTGRDYMAFLQMLMNFGRFRGGQLLQPKTVAMMNQNQIGDISAGILKTAAPARSNDVDFFPGIPCRWGLGYMINMQPGPNGRAAGSLTWAGIFNTYYWLDPQRRIAGVFLTQILPFADGPAVRAYGEFEKAVYGLPTA